MSEETKSALIAFVILLAFIAGTAAVCWLGAAHADYEWTHQSP